MPNLFNAGALFILFREALEAAIVIGVLLNFIDKTVSQHKNLAARLRKQIWLGVGVGLAISLVVGVVFSVVYYVLRQDVFGTFEPIWEGTFKTIACILLTVMGFGMLHAGDLERKWERKMLRAGLAEATKEQMLKEQKERIGTPEGEEEETGLSRNGSVPTVVDSDTVALETAAPTKSMAKRALGLFSFKKDEATKEAEAKEANRPWALFILSFSVVLREGLESVIFLTGVGQGEPYSLVIPGIIGIALGLGIGKLLHRGFAKLYLKTFLFVSAIFIFIIAAGLAANSAHEFEEFAYVKRGQNLNSTLYASFPAPITPDNLVAALGSKSYPNDTTKVSVNSFRRTKRQADVKEVPNSPPKIENTTHPDCPSINGTARTTCKVRTYYIAADELEWDYAPSGYDHVSGFPFVLEKDTAGVFTLHAEDKIGSKYIKAVYYEYTDDTYTVRKAKFAWQGFLGPIIRAEVGDVVRIFFKNQATTPISIHPHGSIYQPGSEGASTQWNMMGAPVNPGEVYEYIWKIAEETGPAVNDPNSILWAYHSHLTEGSDIYAGSVGGIIVYRPGFLNDTTNQARDVQHEYITLFGVFDESMSTYVDINIAQYTPNLIDYANVDAIGAKDDFDESNKMHSINGRVYNNLDGLVAVKGDKIRWHAFAIGNEVDLHSAHWHGNTFIESGHRRDVVELLPATFRTVDMTANNPGTWLIHCHVVDHISAGMITSYQVKNAASDEENVWTIPLAPMDMPPEYPESTPVLWDASGCCDQENNVFWQIMNALCGWRAIATVATVCGYFGYWAILAIIAVLIPRLRKKKTAEPVDESEDAKEKILEEPVSSV